MLQQIFEVNKISVQMQLNVVSYNRQMKLFVMLLCISNAMKLKKLYTMEINVMTVPYWFRPYLYQYGTTKQNLGRPILPKEPCGL